MSFGFSRTCSQIHPDRLSSVVGVRVKLCYTSEAFVGTLGSHNHDVRLGNFF